MAYLAVVLVLLTVIVYLFLGNTHRSTHAMGDVHGYIPQRTSYYFCNRRYNSWAI